jgi:hypothetical protein
LALGVQGVVVVLSISLSELRFDYVDPEQSLLNRRVLADYVVPANDANPLDGSLHRHHAPTKRGKL